MPTSPNREDIEDDGIPFAEKFAGLRATLTEQFTEGRALEARIEAAFDAVVPHVS